MTRQKKAGKIIRWGLFALWVLCIGAGVVYLFGFYFDFGAGLFFAPSFFLSYFYYVFWSISRAWSLNDNAIIWISNIIYIGMFIFTQWLLLSSKKHWKVKTQKTGKPMKRAAIGVAFAVSLLSTGIIYSVWDLISDFDFEEGLTLFIILSIPLVFWVIWSVVFSIYFYQRDYLKWSGRIIKGLIGGSILELFISIPIFVTREDDCYCARGSYAGIVFGATVLLWAFGPGVYLLFLREKKRLEKIEEKSEEQ